MRDGVLESARVFDAAGPRQLHPSPSSPSPASPSNSPAAPSRSTASTSPSRVASSSRCSGPSGCGKSTALRLIAGLGAPTRGTISWSGDTPGARRNGLEVGFVFQEPTLMPWSTVAHNVALPLELAGVPREARDKRVAAALEQVGLAGFRDAFPRELSGGMKMRVSIARGLVTDPPLLLMDEPFAALDEITRFKLNDDLITLWRAVGNTVVFVTHSVFESVYLRAASW